MTTPLVSPETCLPEHTAILRRLKREEVEFDTHMARAAMQVGEAACALVQHKHTALETTRKAYKEIRSRGLTPEQLDGYFTLGNAALSRVQALMEEVGVAETVETSDSYDSATIAYRSNVIPLGNDPRTGETRSAAVELTVSNDPYATEPPRTQTDRQADHLLPMRFGVTLTSGADGTKVREERITPVQYWGLEIDHYNRHLAEPDQVIPPTEFGWDAESMIKLADSLTEIETTRATS